MTKRHERRQPARQASEARSEDRMVLRASVTDRSEDQPDDRQPDSPPLQGLQRFLNSGVGAAGRPGSRLGKAEKRERDSPAPIIPLEGIAADPEPVIDLDVTPTVMLPKRRLRTGRAPGTALVRTIAHRGPRSLPDQERERPHEVLEAWVRSVWFVDPAILNATIDRLSVEPIWRVRLIVQKESRRFQRRHLDPRAAAPAGPLSLDSESAPLSRLVTMLSLDVRQARPGPAVFDRCMVCHGTNVMACMACHGHGWAACEDCRGTMSRSCRWCLGHGRPLVRTDGLEDTPVDAQMRALALVGQLTVNQRTRQVCIHCGGHGREVCSCGDGKRLCIQCHGQKQVSCVGCGATGRQVTVTEIEREVEIVEKSYYPPETAVPARLLDRLVGVPVYYGDVESTEPAPPKLVPPTIWRMVEAVAEAQRANGRGHVTDILVEAIPATSVHYRWAGHAYAMWRLGLPGDQVYWAPTYPRRWFRDGILAAIFQARIDKG